MQPRPRRRALEVRIRIDTVFMDQMICRLERQPQDAGSKLSSESRLEWP